MLAMKLLWTAHKWIVSIFSWKMGMNFASMVYNFRSSCFSFVKNVFNNKTFQIAFLCCSSPCKEPSVTKHFPLIF